MRSLEDVPNSEPRRYLSTHGYVRLRWLLATDLYAEVYEHRMAAGFPPRHLHVHHRNGDKTDNRPENLVVLTAAEHQKLHGADPDWIARMVASKSKRQPLSSYPICIRESCDRPAQCLNRTVCLKHYKEIQRREKGATKRERGVT